MTDSWEQTNQISMTVQTAELHLPSLDGIRHLALSCKLVSIARGTCQLRLHPISKANSAADTLEIHVDRPLMQGVLYLTPDRFDRLCDDFLRIGSRSVTITLTLAETLAVSLAGDLRINEPTSIGITDAGFVFPLR